MISSLKPALLAVFLNLPVFFVAAQTSLPCDDIKNQVLSDTPSDTVNLITSFIPATPAKRVDPRYPREAAKYSQEGWVQMSYVIDKRGHVQNIIVDDYMGNKAFKGEAVKALKKWKFDPAIKDGEPTQQCHQRVQFDFVIPGVKGASRRFVPKYKTVLKFIKNHELEKADNMLTRLHAQTSFNRYENAWRWSADARLAAALGDERRELKSLSRTLSSSDTHDPKHATFHSDYIAYMHQKMFMLYAKFGQYALALKSAERLKNMDGKAEQYAAIEEQINRVNAFIASSQNIAVPLNLDNSGWQSHSLVRNQFAFIDVHGQLDTVQVRCDSHLEQFTVAKDHVWKIPESWGQCRVMIEGKEGTAFSLVEVASI